MQYFSVFSFFSNLLCLRSSFPRLLSHIPSSFWLLPLVGEVGLVVCVGFVLGGTCVCILVGGGEFFSPSDGQDLRVGRFWGVCGRPLH